MYELIANPLILPIALSLAAGLVCLLVPRIIAQMSGYIAVAASALTLWFVWPLFTAGFLTLDYRFLHLNVDMLSRFIVLAIGMFGFLISLYSIGYMKGKDRRSEYYAYLLWSISAALCIAMAHELIVLLIGWGFLGFLLYALVGIAGEKAAAAAKKSLIIIGGTDAILLLGIAMFWHLTGTTHLGSAQPLELKSIGAVVALCAFVIAAFAKAGAMPFHSWVPDCGQYGPASVAAFLPASLDKLLGIYLLARVSQSWFVLTPVCYQILMLFGAATIVFAVMMALVQHDYKRLLSYHAVSQVGYMVLGIGTGTALGLAGALFHMLNNTLFKSCLFLSAGAVEQQAGTTDLDKLGGLAKVMPVTFIACAIAAFSISGIPPLNGFTSKWMIYQGLVDAGRNGGVVWIACLVAAMLGSALTLASFVKVLHAVFLCKMDPALSARKPREVGFAMYLPMVVLALLCIVFGVGAFKLPLAYAILPAVPDVKAFIGTFWAGPATIMLLMAAALGVLIYVMTTARHVRTVSTYIGGEILERAYLSDVPAGERNIEVTGVDFYRTIQNLPVIGWFYAKAELKWFDPYVVGGRLTLLITNLVRQAYTGSLPLYLGWFMGGVLVICAVVFFGGVRW